MAEPDPTTIPAPDPSTIPTPAPSAAAEPAPAAEPVGAAPPGPPAAPPAAPSIPWQDLATSPTPKAAEPPSGGEKYTSAQLSDHKAQMLLKMTQAQGSGDEALAQQCARTVVWCDEQLQQRHGQNVQELVQREQLIGALRQAGDNLLQPYAQDLTPASPLGKQTQGIFQALVSAGYPATDLTARLAAIVAIQASGHATKGIAQKVRQDLTQEMQMKIKEGVVAGGGGAQTKPAGPMTAADIDKMSKEEFATYRSRLRNLTH